MLAADYVFGAAILIVIGCTSYFGPKIKGERIAMQWGVDGNPTWTAPKQMGLWWDGAIYAGSAVVYLGGLHIRSCPRARCRGGNNRFFRHSRGCASLRFDGGQEGKLKLTRRPAAVVRRQT
jgi:hypothetical protein